MAGMLEEGPFGFVGFVNAMKSSLKCELTLQQTKNCLAQVLSHIGQWCDV